ncbi:response regulator [Bradyrhizobium sp. CCGB12]|uniref:response regulator n=1 Tax=Bradyrhizobium sp. CCGB12 TaxID=2949632 RepID=UPI0020B29061|nr:response regulator [Bradyrhizobium sp. CCGB12]MCP3395480.1 response regulator [Bradyrhizobium sp. CCGB12]
MLLVEDGSLQREILADLLKDEGFEIVQCANRQGCGVDCGRDPATNSERSLQIINLAGWMTGGESAEFARPC